VQEKETACEREAGRFESSIGRILIEVVCALSEDTQRKKMTAVKIFMADTSSVPPTLLSSTCYLNARQIEMCVSKRSPTKLPFITEIAMTVRPQAAFTVSYDDDL
jgi:hypothetical protein